MLVNKVIFLPENDLLIKSVISIHRRFKFSTNIQRPNCLYPPTPDRQQSKTFLTIDERHRRQGIWTNPGRFAPDPVRPLDVSLPRRFAPGRFAPGRFVPLVVSPLVDSPQEEISTYSPQAEISTYFVEIYVNS